LIAKLATDMNCMYSGGFVVKRRDILVDSGSFLDTFVAGYDRRAETLVRNAAGKK
jgi:hypothetical protein